MDITWFGHSAFRLRFADVNVLIDPFLTGNGSFKGDIAAETAGTTHILLTHGHSDHVGDTLAIAERTGAKVVTNFEICMYLGKRGLKAFDPMNTGGATDQGAFTVTLTQALHSSSVMDENGVQQDLGLPNGIVVTPKDHGEPTVYHMGDTDIFSDMGLIAALHQPKVVMVPIGDRFTMGARSAAMAVMRFVPHASTVIPCHYATFPMLVPNADAFMAEMGEDGGRVKVAVPGVPFTV
jgi:L-ascorbate metabolism protein UlaG (beta-lactamase superfamily)